MGTLKQTLFLIFMIRRKDSTGGKKTQNQIKQKQNMGLDICHVWAEILALLVIYCVILSKRSHFSRS